MQEGLLFTTDDCFLSSETFTACDVLQQISKERISLYHLAYQVEELNVTPS
jgi:hypothetical protein